MAPRLSYIEKQKQRIAELKQAEQRREQGFVPLTTDELAARFLGVRELLPTQRKFIFENRRVALYMGPVGCAKSASLIGSVLMPALLMPGSRWGLFRAHWWTLKTTTLEVFRAALRRLGPRAIIDKQEGPPFQVWLNPAVAMADAQNASKLEPVEFLCYGLDDLEKLGSQEFTGVAIDEVSEITSHVAHTLNTRLRHKLPTQETAQGPFFWRAACNPVNKAHWVHREFCGEEGCDIPPWGKKYLPHPRENEKNLPAGYYDTIGKSMAPALRLRYIEGQCGSDPSGKPVFPEFSNSLHVGELRYVPRRPMIRSWDFGRRRPACLFAQVTPEGWVNRLRAELGENEPLQRFADRMLRISAVNYPLAESWTDFCDPHGVQKKDTSEETSVDVLRKKGLKVRYRDLSVAKGLEFMSQGLSTLVAGRPRSMYDRAGCQILIDGYQSGYCYTEPTPGRVFKEEPIKDGYYDHLMDCDRYLEVGLNLGSTVEQDKWPTSLRKKWS